jgi:hypothetical protein
VPVSVTRRAIRFSVIITYPLIIEDHWSRRFAEREGTCPFRQRTLVGLPPKLRHNRSPVHGCLSTKDRRVTEVRLRKHITTLLLGEGLFQPSKPCMIGRFRSTTIATHTEGLAWQLPTI